MKKTDRSFDIYRTNIKNFIAALKAAGVSVSISATKRPPQRAYLMHYAWKIANNMVSPSEVPDIKNVTGHSSVDWTKLSVNIDWQHLDSEGNPQETKAREAARAMVRGYAMRDKASLTSNHIANIAVDMTLKGYKGKPIKKANGTTAVVNSHKELSREIGATYGVQSTVKKDPVHWSPNGN